MPMKPTIPLAAAALAGCLMAAGASAQTAPATAPAESASAPRPAKLAHADAAFLKQAAENGHAEVESSKLAETKASDAKVKAFAKQMIEDHTKAGQELSTLAASKGVKVSDGPSLAQKAKIKLLGASEGAKFDAKYADQFGVKAHEDTVKLFEKAANESKDGEVKAWASKTLPALKQHLEHAKELKASVGGKS